MKIIKQGSEENLKKVKRFECKECGCVFEADKNEYEKDFHRNETYFECKCPYCGGRVIKSGMEEVNDMLLRK